jgi:aryl-alcohol dehydrogenase-like predicted oxidoreductase
VIPRLDLAPDYSISRLIKGGWHLAGGHGAIDPAQATRDMAAFVDAGVTTFDCADIYTGVEELIGRFRREYPEHAKRIRVHTKFVPDLDRLATVDRAYVEQIVDRSLARLGQERLDLVQFHWWDYAVPRWVEIALELERLRRAGKIDRIGVTNFGTPELRAMVDAGVPVFAHQLQYSVLDDRPEHGMVDYCRANRIALLCYGTVAGGLLSDRWLGRPAPAEPMENRSLVKYRLIVEEFGSWDAFQRLLGVLKTVGDRHGADVATVATRWILDRPGVAAAIVGATNTSHLASHSKLGALVLAPADRAEIEAVLATRRGPPGDVYSLERDREGPHGRIMKYTLNR